MISMIDLACVTGGRQATPAEYAQTEKDIAAFERDRSAHYAPSVQPSVGQFWTGKRKYD